MCKWVCSWVKKTLQTSLVLFFRVRLTRDKRRSPKRMVEFLGAVRTRTSSAHVGSHFSQTMFLRRVCWSWAQRTNVNIRWQGEWARCGDLRFATKCWKTGDFAQSPEDGRKSKLEKKEYQKKASHCFLGIVYPAMLSMGAEIALGESSTECGGTRRCHT